MSTFSLAFSPCPNDTFMMYGIAHRKIDMRGLDFEFEFLDIENLNQSILDEKYDFTKASTAIIPKLTEKYKLLESGSAFGISGGPLLISYPIKTLTENSTIAIPGLNTSANLIFNRYFKTEHKKKFVLFSEVYGLLEKNEADAGIIIHEDRFTYKSKGFECILDLGQKWISETVLPVPLGNFFARQNIDKEIIKETSNLIKESIKYAYNNYDKALPWIKKWARNEDEKIISQHIKYYVNDLSVSLGEIGEQALTSLHSSEIKKLILQKENKYYTINISEK